MLDAMLDLPRLIGHRGAARHAPENTLGSIRAAAEQGARWVEFDVKLSADRVPLLMHDDTVDRTTNGRGAVAAMSFAALRALDAGSWFDPKFRGERIPSLAEALDLIAALGLGFNLEIKPCPGRAEETAGVALTMAANVWPEDRPPPLISSFDREAMAVAHRVMPDWPRGFLMDQPPPDWRVQMERLECATLHINARRRGTEAAMPSYLAAGRPVLAYTVNRPADAKEVFSWGVRAVFTDTPMGLAGVAKGTGSGPANGRG
jgi:glycerophosphoryl diester phosphodiesterase